MIVFTVITMILYINFCCLLRKFVQMALTQPWFTDTRYVGHRGTRQVTGAGTYAQLTQLCCPG